MKGQAIQTRRVSLPMLVLAGSVITALSLGVRSTFGLFLDPVIDTIGTERGMFALAIAIQNLIWGLSQPFAGAIADRFGSARVLITGTVLYAIGLVMMSSATSAAQFYLSAGFIIGIGMGAASFSIVLAAIGRMAPENKRSLALGIATAMGSIGQFLLVPSAQRLINGRGWEETALILGVIVLLIIAFAPILRGKAADQSSPEEAMAARPLRSELRRAAHSRSYLLLNMAFFVCGFHVTFIAIHLPSYVDDLGQSGTTAATALAFIGLFNVFGSLAAGVLGGRYSKTKLLSIIYAARAVTITGFVLLPASSLTTLLFGASMGLLWLATVPLTGGIVVQQFGTTHSGTLFGIVFLSHQLGAFSGAWLGGALADAAGGYAPVWWIAVALGVMAAVTHLFIDEGPVPEPPPAGLVGVRIAPAGGLAAVLLTVGIAAGLARGLEDSPPVAADERSGTPAFCVLHPTPDR